MFGANTGEVQEVRQYLADGTAAVVNVSYDFCGNLSQTNDGAGELPGPPAR